MSSKRTVKKASSTSATGTKTKASSSPKTPNTTKTTKKKTSKQLSPRKSELDPSVDQDYEGLMSAEHQHELGQLSCLNIGVVIRQGAVKPNQPKFVTKVLKNLFLPTHRDI